MIPVLCVLIAVAGILAALHWAWGKVRDAILNPPGDNRS